MLCGCLIPNDFDEQEDNGSIVSIGDEYSHIKCSGKDLNDKLNKYLRDYPQRLRYKKKITYLDPETTKTPPCASNECWYLNNQDRIHEYSGKNYQVVVSEEMDYRNISLPSSYDPDIFTLCDVCFFDCKFERCISCDLPTADDFLTIDGKEWCIFCVNHAFLFDEMTLSEKAILIIEEDKKRKKQNIEKEKQELLNVVKEMIDKCTSSNDVAFLRKHLLVNLFD